MPFTTDERRLVINAASRLSLDDPPERIEAFVSRVLKLTPLQTQQYFPDPDPQEQIPQIISEFTNARQDMLTTGDRLPKFIVRTNGRDQTYLEGLRTYLSRTIKDTLFLKRLSHQDAIRDSILSLQAGDHLEALAAAIMDSSCTYGCATQRSGDQGIDALGWDELLPVERAFTHGDFKGISNSPGEKVFILTSAKANIKNKTKSTTINPAFIRELVGGWLIQRSSIGAWRQHGIQLLSPVQLVLATTYKLSPDAKDECRQLGVQIWGTAVIVYLICRHSPGTVFPNAGRDFSRVELRRWWRPHDRKRLKSGP